MRKKQRDREELHRQKEWSVQRPWGREPQCKEPLWLQGEGRGHKKCGGGMTQEGHGLWVRVPPAARLGPPWYTQTSDATWEPSKSEGNLILGQRQEQCGEWGWRSGGGQNRHFLLGHIEDVWHYPKCKATEGLEREWSHHSGVLELSRTGEEGEV